MTSHPLLMTVLLIGAIPLPVSAQDTGKTANAKNRAIVDRTIVARQAGDRWRARLLDAIEVNGMVLSPLELKREIVFLAGTNAIEVKIVEFIAEEWKQRMIKEEGRLPADFAIDDTLIEKEVRKDLREFALKYPDLDYWEVVRSQSGISRDLYIHRRRVTMSFVKVFMPGPPDRWPQITKEAFKAVAKGSGGSDLLDDLVKNSRDKNGKLREMPKFWAEMIRKMIVGQLKRWSDIKYPADGLPADVVLDVNGRQWKTGDAFERLANALSVQDMELAIRELIIREALGQELRSKGFYLSDKDFRDGFNEYRKQFDDTLINPEMLARAFKGYPTLHAFRTRWRLIKSYENMIAGEINDDSLQRHADRYERFFAGGSIDVDVIPFMGKSRETGVWQADGMDKALARAQRCVAAIRAGQRSFDAALEESGEFPAQDPEKGRLRSKSLTGLGRSLRESEYTDVLTGFSLANFAFYHAEVGKVIGPLMSADSWFVIRVNSREPGQKEVSIEDARTRELVKQDYLAHRFFAWSKGVIRNARIK